MFVSLSRDIPSYSIQKANPTHDFTAIVEVVNEAYKKAEFLLGNRTSLEEIESIVKDPTKILYLCLSPTKEICGTILLDYSKKEEVELGLFAIHPKHQKTGIGTQFIRKVEKEAFASVPTIVMTVIPHFQRNLIAFYKKLGYTQTGQTEKFPEDSKKLIKPEYRDQLCFCIMKKMKIRSLL